MYRKEIVDLKQELAHHKRRSWAVTTGASLEVIDGELRIPEQRMRAAGSMASEQVPHIAQPHVTLVPS